MFIFWDPLKNLFLIVEGNTLVDFEDMDYLDYYSSPAYMRLANTGHSVMMDIGKCHPLYEFFGKIQFSIIVCSK